MILTDIIIRRPAGADGIDLDDLTDSTRTGPAYWHPEQPDALVIPLDPEPSDDEAAAIRRRLVSVDAADESRLVELLDAADDPLTPIWAKLTLQSELAAYGQVI